MNLREAFGGRVVPNGLERVLTLKSDFNATMQLMQSLGLEIDEKLKEALAQAQDYINSDGFEALASLEHVEKGYIVPVNSVYGESLDGSQYLHSNASTKSNLSDV